MAVIVSILNLGFERMAVIVSTLRVTSKAPNEQQGKSQLWLRMNGGDRLSLIVSTNGSDNLNWSSG